MKLPGENLCDLGFHYEFSSQHQKQDPGTSLAVQWLVLRASNAGGTGSIPGWGTRIPRAAWHGQKIFKKEKKKNKVRSIGAKMVSWTN